MLGIDHRREYGTHSSNTVQQSRYEDRIKDIALEQHQPGPACGLPLSRFEAGHAENRKRPTRRVNCTMRENFPNSGSHPTRSPREDGSNSNSDRPEPNLGRVGPQLDLEVHPLARKVEGLNVIAERIQHIGGIPALDPRPLTRLAVGDSTVLPGRCVRSGHHTNNS